MQHFRFLFYRTSRAQEFFFLISLHQIDNRTAECYGTDYSYITGHLVVKIEPIDIRIKEFLEHQDEYSTSISDEINSHNKESYISFYLEACYEAVEKYALKTKVGNVKAQTLDEQPSHGAELKRIVIE